MLELTLRSSISVGMEKRQVLNGLFGLKLSNKAIISTNNLPTINIS